MFPDWIIDTDNLCTYVQMYTVCLILSSPLMQIWVCGKNSSDTQSCGYIYIYVQILYTDVYCMRTFGINLNRWLQACDSEASWLHGDHADHCCLDWKRFWMLWCHRVYSYCCYFIAGNVQYFRDKCILAQALAFIAARGAVALSYYQKSDRVRVESTDGTA